MDSEDIVIFLLGTKWVLGYLPGVPPSSKYKLSLATEPGLIIFYKIFYIHIQAYICLDGNAFMRFRTPFSQAPQTNYFR